MSASALTLARQRKAPVFILLLLPALWMLYQALFAQALLGADPAKNLVDQTGLWAIRAILLALAITPLRIISGQSAFLLYRRMTGLFAFFYASLHFIVYIVLLMALDTSRIWDDLSKRPYIIVGMLALLSYIPLAITSTQGWQRRLKRNWVRLHKLAYLIGILAVVHMTWLKKVGLYDTWPYAAVLVVLLMLRVANFLRKKSRV